MEKQIKKPGTITPISNSMVLFLILVMLLTGLVSHSQEKKPLVNSIYMTPTKSLELENLNHYPRISLGTDGHITKNWYYDLSIAYGNLDFYKTVVFDDNYKNKKNIYSIFDIQPTLKNMLQQSRKLSVFLGGSLFYTKRHQELIDGYYYPDDANGVIYYDAARMHDHRIGGQVYFESNLSFENIGFSFYTTCGLGYGKIKYTNVKNPQNNDYPFEEWWVPRIASEGNIYPFQLTFGLKIHFILNQYKKFQNE